MEEVNPELPHKQSDQFSGSSLSSSSKDYISSPSSQIILKQATLSVKDLYEHINKLVSKRNKQPLLKHGELLKQGRYVVHRLIGRGAFGEVVEAFDKEKGETVAIKVIRRNIPFSEHVQREINILKMLNEVDSDRGFIVRMLDHFVWEGHPCIVFEYLSKSLYQLLREINFKGLPLTHVRIFAWQLLSAITLLSLPTIKVVHCDLKPENIMLKSSDRSGIKVIDFGSSCRTGQKMYKYVQSRYYRAPEVLLELPYGSPIDIWSLGCILVELHVGQPLFMGVNKIDQMAKITELLGFPPSHMIKASRKSKEFFIKQGNKYSLKSPPFYRPDQLNVIHNQRPTNLEDLLGVSTGGPRGQWPTDTEHSPLKYSNFLDLIRQMLHYEPEKRITPYEALRHQFFTDVTFTQGNTSGVQKFSVPKISSNISHITNLSPLSNLTIKRRPGSYRSEKTTQPPWPSAYPYIMTKKTEQASRPLLPKSKLMMSPVCGLKFEDSSSQGTSPWSKQSTDVSNSLFHSPVQDGVEYDGTIRSRSGISLVTNKRPSSHNVRAGSQHEDRSTAHVTPQ